MPQEVMFRATAAVYGGSSHWSHPKLLIHISLKPPNIVLQTCTKAPATLAPGHAPLEAGDALGMQESTLAHSCGRASTKLPREPKAAFQTHISFPSPSTTGSHKPCHAAGRTAGLGGSRAQHCCGHGQHCCGQLATNHIRRR